MLISFWRSVSNQTCGLKRRLGGLEGILEALLLDVQKQLLLRVCELTPVRIEPRCALMRPPSAMSRRRGYASTAPSGSLALGFCRRLCLMNGRQDDARSDRMVRVQIACDRCWWHLGTPHGNQPRLSFSSPHISSRSGAEHGSPLRNVSACPIANRFALDIKETCAQILMCWSDACPA